MQFRYLLSASAALATALIVSSANAEALKLNPYIGLSGQGAFLLDADNKGDLLEIESDFDPGFGVSGLVGLEIEDFRIEGEISWRRNDVDELTIENDGGLGIGSPSADADGEVDALTFMANAYYDVDTGTGFKPYIGAGVGAARISADVEALGVAVVDDSDVVFAYQAMAGIAYEVTQQLTIFGGYRYFATQDPNLEDETGADFDSEYRSHNVEVGVRFTF